MDTTETDEGAADEDVEAEKYTDDYSNVLLVAGAVFWSIVIYQAFVRDWPDAFFGVVFLGGITNIYLYKEFEVAFADRDRLDMAKLVACAVVMTVGTVYIAANFDVLNRIRVGYAYDHEYVLAAALLVVITYTAWRAFGRTFLVVVAVAVGYGYFGPYFPGAVSHGGMPLKLILRTTALEFSGMYGFLTRLTASWIALFLLYAGLLKAYGMFDVIHRLALRSAKYIRSGIAQSAVVSSIVIGSINGSPAANVGITGSFTIPLMMNNDIRGDTAGGIESVASTSGQVLPPVMGASAFIMANLLGITYLDVVLAGLLPALIFIIAMAVATHYTAVYQIGDPTAGIERFFAEHGKVSNRQLAIDGVTFVVPFAVLLYTLGIAQWTVISSALYTCITMIAFGLFTPVVKGSRTVDDVVEGLRVGLSRTINGFAYGAIILAPIAIILATINIVVDILMGTGVPALISLTLVGLSGGVMIVAVILSMAVCIMLGLGMPTSASYLLVAVLIAPSLVNQFDVPVLAAHYFVFYSAILSSLTPPVAAACAVACGISGADFLKTCAESIKVGFPLFVLPFVFIYNPEIVDPNFTLNVLVTATFVLLGALSISFGLNYFTIPFGLTDSTNWGVRGIYTVAGTIVMVYPGTLVRLALLVGIGLLYPAHRRYSEKPDLLPAEALS